MTATRQSTVCPIFGASCLLPTATLPSYGDVMRHYGFQRNFPSITTPKKHYIF
jgi:hypothetical protein